MVTLKALLISDGVNMHGKQIIFAIFTNTETSFFSSCLNKQEIRSWERIIYKEKLKIIRKKLLKWIKHIHVGIFLYTLCIDKSTEI